MHSQLSTGELLQKAGIHSPTLHCLSSPSPRGATGSTASLISVIRGNIKCNVYLFIFSSGDCICPKRQTLSSNARPERILPSLRSQFWVPDIWVWVPRQQVPSRDKKKQSLFFGSVRLEIWPLNHHSGDLQSFFCYPNYTISFSDGFKSL